MWIGSGEKGEEEQQLPYAYTASSPKSGWKYQDGLPRSLTSPTRSPPTGYLVRHAPNSRKRFICFLAFLCMIPLALKFLSYFPYPPYYPPTTQSLSVTTLTRGRFETDDAQGSRRLIIVLPADSPSPDLCKHVASAIALGYPSPVIVNWGKDFQKSKDSFGLSHLGKITGTLEYLEAATQPDLAETTRIDDGDLVLVLDAYDVWFQLPPEVLLKRYHEANAVANYRLREQWLGDAPMPMEQTIIVSAQKSCFPWDAPGQDLHCDDLPESPLPPDLYGENTEKKSNDHHNIRPKYLNSGSIMGPAGDLKRYFGKVKERMEYLQSEGNNLKSDQGIFGEIFGEQEVWRRLRRRRSQHPFLVDQENTMPGLERMDLNYEYHVGLDYTQELFLPTIYVDKDGGFTRLGNEQAIEQFSRGLGISPPRLEGVPKDVAESKNPLLNVTSEPPSWGDMPLYADFFTTAVPAVIHHNAWRGKLKGRRKHWWSDTWYFPYLRELLEFRMSSERAESPRELGQVGKMRYLAPRHDDEDRKPKLFNSERMDKALLRSASWEEICSVGSASSSQWHSELFRDGKGPLAEEL